eukprot:780674_1
MANLWLVGAFLSIAGSVCSNIGVNVQKHGQNINARRHADDRRSYHNQPFWWLGLFLVIVGSLGDFFALGFAAQSIVAPIGSITLVANIFFGRFCLQEHLQRTDIHGTLLIIVGASLAVSFGSHDDPTYTYEQLLQLYTRVSFQLYAGIVVCLLAVLYLAIRVVEPQRRNLLELFEQLEEATRARRKSDARVFLVRIRELEARYKQVEKLHPFFYCSLSGLCGGQSLLFAKCVSLMLHTTLEGNNQFTVPWGYLFMFLMLFFVFTQLHYLAVALKFFDALYCVPVFQCFFILCGTVSGAIYFEEFADFTTTQALFFPFGVGITLFGVYLLTKREMGKSLYEENAMKAAAAMQSEPERKNFPSIFRWKKKEHALIGGQQKSEYTEYADFHVAPPQRFVTDISLTVTNKKIDSKSPMAKLGNTVPENNFSDNDYDSDKLNENKSQELQPSEFTVMDSTGEQISPDNKSVLLGGKLSPKSEGCVITKDMVSLRDRISGRSSLSENPQSAKRIHNARGELLTSSPLLTSQLLSP